MTLEKWDKFDKEIISLDDEIKILDVPIIVPETFKLPLLLIFKSPNILTLAFNVFWEIE